MIYYQDNHIELYCKDCRQMTELVDNSVQCVVTSPPYWGLRKYSGEQELIWGDNHCEHQWVTERTARPSGSGGKPSPTNPYAYKLATHGTDNYSEYVDYHDRATYTNFCSLCGAWKGAFGLEPTPEMYVQHTIEILREIRRVLRKDGVVFWNIGDSYQGGNRGASAESDIKRGDQGGSFQPHNIGAKGIVSPSRLSHPTIKPKDLCLIPFRIAIAAQEDGWWVRSVIIWSKPNPMPESVTDRPTESHEYILMLTKSARYYWDADAVREAHKPETIERYQYGYKESERDKLGHSHHGKGYQRNDGSPIELNAGRNIRTVWEFPTQPYPEAHFAVFPEKLPELCIKAASKPDDLVLDPFAGAGTTLWVAKKLNRQAVGYEISQEYCGLALERNRQQVLI